ncbi:hypothetical protein CDD80_2829 [Ophiocordyceps camponoti-rufipedis]|uniref:Probable glucan endo-1,3-beta-glucosidase eglC n=1 Tax=Ophiocordyceps camponoti-rufipedis TaxID=2004952 RepID=A0A2C5Z4Q2_9HYPO|nr:hypothetical protein CDD80_2829 [Ophiocordyceps camponoti-rufipedis]
MPLSTAQLIVLAAAVSSASAGNFRGFNYGNMRGTSPKMQADFESEFKAAQALPGTGGAFRSARLYTMIQGGTANDPISAIDAAISTNTSMLLGIWASAGDATFANEMEALRKTTEKYCKDSHDFDTRVVGISIGSEDLYRDTPTGHQNGENPGCSPDTLVRYIKKTRDVIKGTCLEKTPMGHVDTWTAYANSSNEAVIAELDWLGVDEYPFYEYQKPNAIEQASGLYHDALNQVQAVIDKGGKKQEIWITEMGWPVAGKDSGQAVASPENAEKYYKTVACPEFEARNVWYFTLQDGDATNKPNPSFGVVEDVVGRPLKPLFDLSCGEANSSAGGAGKGDEKGGSAGSDKSGKGSGSSSGSSSGAGSSSSPDSGNDSGSNSSSNSGSKSDSSPGSGSGSSSNSSSDTGSKSDSTSGSTSGSNNTSGSGSRSDLSSGSGSNSSSTTGSKSDSSSGSGSGSGSSSSSGSTSGSGPGSGSTTVSSMTTRPTGASNSTTNTNTNGGQLTTAGATGSHVNSVGAAAVAVVLALAAL